MYFEWSFILPSSFHKGHLPIGYLFLTSWWVINNYPVGINVKWITRGYYGFLPVYATTASLVLSTDMAIR